MKKLSYLFLAPFIATFFIFSCDSINLDSVLNNDDISAGLKEALNVGTDTAVAKGSLVNGYFENPDITIFFPQEAAIVETVVGAFPGGDELIADFIEQMNHAAEDAADEAAPIFKDAITGITFDDATAILDGADTAATNYLRVKTFSDLYAAFKPDIQTSLENVGAQQTWEDVMDWYNSIPLTTDVTTDLADYTTNKGLDGLFHLVGEEEIKIRSDVSHQVSNLLQQVFGN